MTTTVQHQKVPDFFTSLSGCETNKFTKKVNSNPRYPSFNQVHFTCGDVEQFEHYRDQSNGTNPNPNIDLGGNVWEGEFIPDEANSWKKYKNLTTESVDNTFKYLFNKFKKGVFIKIKDNKLDVFLPFSKINYINDWGNNMRYDPTKFRSMLDFLIYTGKIQGYNVNPQSVHQNPSFWYANNSLVRYENPPSENDRGLSAIKDMLNSLCRERIVPDIEIFINKRDFPLIKKDDTEPYENIFDDPKFKLKSHRYDKYCPILSTVGTVDNVDIPMPTAEDWTRASNQEEGKFFSDICRSYKYDFKTPWSHRIPTAVFRGASTGSGTTIETNPRLKISQLSTIAPNNLLDAGITKWNLRPRKVMGNPYLQLIEPDKLPFGLVKSLTPGEQSKYKYVVNVDGHVSAFRLSLELSMGSVILLVDSKYTMWFRKYLVEYEHYVPVKEDLSDLFEKIQWCRDNDSKCEEIAKNARDFYDKYLTKKGILDYMQLLLIDIKKNTGNYFYNSVKIQDIIMDQEHSILSELQSHVPSAPLDPEVDIIYPFEDRNFYGMEGLQMFMRKNGGIDISSDDRILIHQSRDGSIYKIENVFPDSNISFVVKKSDRVDELVNEAFVGITSINPLIREIPNFRYTYCISRSDIGVRDTTILENIEGDTFQKYINDGCSFEDFRKTIMMTLLALAVAQEKIGFVHNDLYPWNIIMLKVDRQKIVYQFRGVMFVVETDVIPVIIDYGRAHVIYDGQHYGTMKTFKTSLFQDCFCLLISSVYEMSLRNNSDVNMLIYMTNFFTGSDLYPNKIKNYQELMTFLGIHKKYNEMVFGDKCAIESHNPINLFQYIFQSSPNVGIMQVVFPNKVEYKIPLGNPLFYYDIIIKRNPRQDILLYLEQVESCVDYLYSSNTNIVTYINSCNYFTLVVKSIMEKFGGDIKVTQRCNIILTRVAMKYISHADQMTRDIKFGYINSNESLIISSYTPETFSVPSKILTRLQGDSKPRKTNILSFRKDFMFNMMYDLPYQIPDENLFFMDKRYLSLIKMNPLVIINHNANINTLKNVAKKVYLQDIEKLSQIPDEKPIKTLQVFNAILNVING
jgi:hypothetical protein